MRIAAGLCLFLAGFALSGCQTGSGDDSPTAPGGIPTPGSTINYTAIGASDANGVGSSAPCFPFENCPNGKGYVPVATASLHDRNFQVSLLNLGIPTAVISQRIQSLGQSVGRTILGNFISDELPFVRNNATLVTIFSGGNDVDTIMAAVNAGLGGSTPAAYNAYIDQQVAAFGSDYATLVSGIRAAAPSARIVVLNLPNLGALPYRATQPLTQRQAAQRVAVGMTTTVINPLTAQGIVVVDLMCEPRIYQPAQLSADGFHPNDAGYAILAGAVVAAVTSTSYPSPQSSCSQMTSQ